MPGRDIIVVGASAGGVEALVTLVGSLPEEFPAALFIVLHIPAQSPSMLPAILSRSGSHTALHPRDGDAIEPGKIYVAPPDRHLMLEHEYIGVVRGPKENRHRPSVDPLFRSAARAFGPRVIGVVLTGSLDDGTAGLLAIKRRGGIAIVQDPEDALYPSMPVSAIQHVTVDYVRPLAEIGPLLVQLVHEPLPKSQEPPVPEDMELETRITEFDMEMLDNEQTVGTPSVFSCPECGGVLWEVQDGELLRFRCRVGHAFSADSMFSAQSEEIEDALWSALKTLEENASLSRRMADQARKRGQDWLARTFDEKIHESEQRSAAICQVLQKEVLIDTTEDNGINPS